MKLSVSKNLVKIKANDGYILYNSLFGNPVKVSQKLFDLINSFEGGNTVENVINTDTDNFKKKILNLKEKKLLVEFGIDENDEYNAFMERVIGPKITDDSHINTLQLSVTSSCNFACKHCYCPVTAEWEDRKFMSFKVAKLAIDSFLFKAKKDGLKNLFIIFFGGEPLLNWRLIKRSLDYIDSLELKNIDICYVLGTNGSIMNSEIADYIKRYNIKIDVSLDGLKGANDKFRFFKDGRGAFDKITETLEFLDRHKIKIVCDLCLNDYNINGLKEFADYISSRYNNIRVLAIHQLSYKRDTWNFDTFSCQEKVQKIVDVYEYCKKNNMFRVFGKWLYPVLRLRYSIETPESHFEKNNHCAYKRMMHVKPSGMVYPCNKIRSPLGSIFKFNDIYSQEPYNTHASRWMLNISSCKKCEIKGFCRGGCAAIAEYYTGSIFNTDHPGVQEVCEVNRIIFKEFLVRLFEYANAASKDEKELQGILD